MTYQKYAAEALGTFVLTFAVLAALTNMLPIATSIIAGLVLGLFVYAIGDISGAHINPAVTVGLWTQKVLSGSEAVQYIIAQVAGALLAGRLALSMFGSSPLLVADNTMPIGVAEGMGAFILVFVISAVVAGRIHKAASGLAVGGALTLGILLTVPISNGVLNPAVAIGIGSSSLMYLVAPLVGGWLGAWSYSWLTK